MSDRCTSIGRINCQAKHHYPLTRHGKRWAESDAKSMRFRHSVRGTKVMPCPCCHGGFLIGSTDEFLARANRAARHRRQLAMATA
jgi:hypothetical protein